MTEPDDLEPRVAALEGEVRRLHDEVRRIREDAAAARVLAGGSDRDVGELGAELRDFRQATVRAMNAMREDITDLREEVRTGFAQVWTNFGEVRTGLAAVDRNFDEIRERLDAAGAGQTQIAAMLQALIDREG